MRYKYLYATDMLSLIFSLIFALLSLLNLGKVQINLAGITLDRELFLGLTFVIIIFSLLLLFKATNHCKNRIIHFIRLFYPQLLYILFFGEAILLSQLFYNNYSFDWFFSQIDFMLFSSQPSITFHQLVPNTPLITELVFFSYFFFFPLICSGWWLLYLQGRMREAVRAFLITTISFYILFLVFIFFPVKGPKYFFPYLNNRWYNNFEGFFFTSFMRNLFNHMNLAGAAFPSSHVALSLVAILLNRRYNWPLAFVFITPTILLFFSTVFIYAHYVVDVIGGIISGILLYNLAPKLYRLFRPSFSKLDYLIGRIFHLRPLADLSLIKTLDSSTV
jgi:membrane-associated phospholipid phosphatase